MDDPQDSEFISSIRAHIRTRACIYKSRFQLLLSYNKMEWSINPPWFRTDCRMDTIARTSLRRRSLLRTQRERVRRYCAAKGAALSHRSRYLPRSPVEGITGSRVDKSRKPGPVRVTLRVIREHAVNDHNLNALARGQGVLAS